MEDFDDTKAGTVSRWGADMRATKVCPVAAIAVAAALLGCAVARPAAAGDGLSTVARDFRAAYGKAADHTLAQLRATVPIFVNRFEQIALYRPGVEQPDVFTIDGDLYTEAKSASHAVSTLFVGLAPYGFGVLSQDRRAWLTTFDTHLAAAVAEVETRQDVPAGLRQSQLRMLHRARAFAKSVLDKGAFSQADMEAYGRSVRADINASLFAAAQSQLNQFRVQLDTWKAKYPTLAWKRAVAVVIAGHQPRRLNLQHQFLDWKLSDDPKSEDKVVFAETLSPPRSLPGNALPPEYLDLLAKVMLDKGFAAAILSDRHALQQDALGNAAYRVIQGWKYRPPH